MSQFLDGLGAQRTSWKKSLSRYESNPLADSEPRSAASSARPSTACRPVQRQRSKSRCSSVSGSRVSLNAAPILGKQVGADKDILESRISELTAQIKAFDTVLGRPTTPRRLVKVRATSALSRPPVRSVTQDADERRHVRSHLGKSVTAVVGNKSKHKSDSIKLLAARVQRGNCQGFQITQNSIVNATRSFQRLTKGSLGRADFNTFDSVMKTIGFTELTIGITGMWDNCLSSKLKVYFKLLALDGNGTIEQSEIEQVVQESGKYNQKQAGEIAKLLFKELDMEGIDGGVSHEQLIIRVLHKPAVLKIFERIFS